MMWTMALPFLAAFLAVGLGSDLPGGVKDVNANNPEIQRAASFAVKEYNHSSRGRHYYALEQVLRAQTQVVAGVKYIMTLKLGKTKCLKGIGSNRCPIIRGRHETKSLICTFTVWYRAWLNNMRLVGSSCRERTTWD